MLKGMIRPLNAASIVGGKGGMDAERKEGSTASCLLCPGEKGLEVSHTGTK